MFWIMGGDYVLRSWPRVHDSAMTRGLAEQMEHCEWAGFDFCDLWFQPSCLAIRPFGRAREPAGQRERKTLKTSKTGLAKSPGQV
jgi:hypothetical protein